jgi:probable addiction module antidote protein
MNKKRIEEITGDFSENLMKELKDPEFAAEFLNAMIHDFYEDQDITSFNHALSYILKSENISKISKESNVSRSNVYRIFNSESKSTFIDMLNLLHASGFDLEVKPREKLV